MALQGLLNRGELDRVIVAGVDGLESPELARRRAHLTRPRARRALAGALESLATQPNSLGRSRGLSSVVPADPDEVRIARPTLMATAKLLRSGEPVTARGMLLVRRLLTDGNGPLYLPREPGEFGSELRAAITRLTCRTPEPRYHRNAAPSMLES
jgi:hypothetical protein